MSAAPNLTTLLAGRVDGPVLGPSGHVRAAAESYAYYVGRLNYAKAWHDEVRIGGMERHFLVGAAHELALAMLRAGQAHDELVGALARIDVGLVPVR